MWTDDGTALDILTAARHIREFTASLTRAQSESPASMTWEHGKALAEIVALVCTGGFFFCKFCLGYFFANLSLGISIERKHSNQPGRDYLSVTAKLEKGDRGSIQIHDAQARVLHLPGSFAQELDPVALQGFERLSNKPETEGDFERRTINGSKRRETSPFLRLTPGENAEFSCLFEVPRNEACIVEVAILGNEQWWVSQIKKWRSLGRKSGMGQWRSSSVSLPIS
jgi:hypothetical protein